MALPKKEIVVGVRTTAARRDLYREVAESEGRRLSEWFRWLADQRVAQLAKERGQAT